MFLFDLDDFFDDLDCEILFLLKFDGGYFKLMNDIKYFVFNGSFVIEEKFVVFVLSNVDEKECSDKDWSMGYGIVDK